MHKSDLVITPETKVAALLEAYPALEEVLIRIAPVFKNLRNPVLRRTIAKVATLDRAAKVAGIATRQLVSQLRAEAGQPTELSIAGQEAPDTACSHGVATDSPPVDATTCDWLREDIISERIDADALLAVGNSPLTAVLASAKALPADSILAVSVAFRPVPLIDVLMQQGFRTFCRPTNGGTFELFVSRPAAQ